MASPFVTACLVTRGDADLTPILESLPSEWPVAIWDNSQRENLSVYGRYALLSEIDTPVAYVQDDDCIVSDPEMIARAWWITRRVDGYVVCNQPAAFRHDFYEDHALVGFGACFHRDLPERAFERFCPSRPDLGEFAARNLIRYTDFFYRACDIVFTGLTPRVLVDVPHTDREFASDPGRMWTTEGHQEERSQMLELVRRVRDEG